MEKVNLKLGAIHINPKPEKANEEYIVEAALVISRAQLNDILTKKSGDIIKIIVRESD